MDVITSLCLLGYSLLLKRLTRWYIEATPFFIVSAFIVIFYILAYSHCLYWGSFLLILGGGIALLAAPFYIDNRHVLFEHYFTPTFVIFILVIICFGIPAHFLVANGWDEVPKWIPHAKFIYLNHYFWRATDPLIGTDSYPPGTALFYYTFLRLSHFSEGHLFYGQLFLLLSPLILLLVKSKWSSWLDIFFMFAFILMVSMVIFKLKMGVRGSLYVDELVGLFFGGILAAYYVLSDRRWLWLYLIFPAMALVLLKPMLWPFILVSSAIIFADHFYLFRQRQKSFKSILLYMGMLILPFIIIFSWRYYVQHSLNSAMQWQLSSLISAIQHQSTSFASNQTHSLLLKYGHKLISSGVFVLYSAIILSLIYRYIPNRGDRGRFLIAQIGLLLGFICYLFSLLLIFFFQMSSYVIFQMESFDRFVNIYEIGWALVMAAQYMSFVKQPVPSVISNLSNRVKYGIAILILVCYGIHAIAFSYVHYHKEFQAKRSSEYIRAIVQQQLAQPLNQALTPQDKIAIVWEGWQLLPYYIFYELLPKQAYVLSEEQLNQQLEKVDYVLIGGKIANDYWNKNKSLFTTPPVLMTQLTLCMGADINDNPNQNHCQLQQFPFYFYRVIHQGNKVRLQPYEKKV